MFEPGGNRIELFGEPGILQLEPDYETRTWLMEDIDTGLAIGGAKLPFETYFTYGTPSKLSVEELCRCIPVCAAAGHPGPTRSSAATRAARPAPAG